MTTGAITLVVPYVSNASLLRRTLESILAQIDLNWQAMVVNNALNEEERRAASSVVRSYPSSRIAYHLNNNHLDQSSNYSHCLELADTDVVCIVHSDDELLPTFVSEVRLLTTRNPSAAAAFVPVTIIDAHSRRRFSFPDFIKRFLVPRGHGDIILRGERGLNTIVRGNYIFSPAAAYRMSALGQLRFDRDLRQAMDLDLWSKILFQGGTIVGSRRPPAYAYRRHSSQITATLTKSLYRFEEEALILDRISQTARRLGWTTVARTANAKTIVQLNLFYLALLDVAAGRWRAAASKLHLRNHLARGSRHCPSASDILKLRD